MESGAMLDRIFSIMKKQLYHEQAIRDKNFLFHEVKLVTQ